MGIRPPETLIAALLALAVAGCGSKISEANYYRIQYGMDEAAVDELLGPAHGDVVLAADATSASAPTRTLKTWSRGGLKLLVVFQDGKVVSRGAEGVPKESPATTRPAAFQASDQSLNISPR